MYSCSGVTKITVFLLNFLLFLVPITPTFAAKIWFSPFHPLFCKLFWMNCSTKRFENACRSEFIYQRPLLLETEKEGNLARKR
jgi:hypothetical protein